MFRVGQAVGQVLQDDTMCKRMNDAGAKYDPIGLMAFVDRVRSGDTARYDQVIQ